MMDRAYEDKLYQISKFVGDIRNLQTKDLRDTGMSRLRGFNRMCSSTLSVNCEKAEKDMLW